MQLTYVYEELFLFIIIVKFLFFDNIRMIPIASSMHAIIDDLLRYGFQVVS